MRYSPLPPYGRGCRGYRRPPDLDDAATARRPSFDFSRLAKLIVIRWIRCPSIVEKEIRIQRSHDGVEKTWLSVKSKKASQISSGACVSKSKRALAEIENTLDEPQYATKVMGLHVIDVVAGRESRDNDQRYAKAIPVIALL